VNCEEPGTQTAAAESVVSAETSNASCQPSGNLCKVSRTRTGAEPEILLHAPHRCSCATATLLPAQGGSYTRSHFSLEELGKRPGKDKQDCRAKQPDEREATVCAGDDASHKKHGKEDNEQETTPGQQTAHLAHTTSVTDYKVVYLRMLFFSKNEIHHGYETEYLGRL
jgi:hypothetical protein